MTDPLRARLDDIAQRWFLRYELGEIQQASDAILGAVHEAALTARPQERKVKCVTARCRNCGAFTDDIEIEYEGEARPPACLIHGDPLVCLACEAEEDTRPEWHTTGCPTCGGLPAGECSSSADYCDGTHRGEARPPADLQRGIDSLRDAANLWADGAYKQRALAALTWLERGEARPPEDATERAARITERIEGFAQRNDGLKLSPNLLAMIECAVEEAITGAARAREAL